MNRFSKRIFIFGLLLLMVSFQAFAQRTFHVSMIGNNRNDGSKASPLRNITRAIELANPGDIILVAEGNYFGALDRGEIIVNKPVSIMGGYSPDFNTRDILRHLTMVQPSHQSNGTAGGQGTMQINVTTANTMVTIDGLIFDRGQTISYNARGEGRPDGVESGMMNPIGTAGLGGPDVTTPNVLTQQSPILRVGGASNITIRNCAFINGPNFAIMGTIQGDITITNCIFVNNRMAAIEVSGGSASRDGNSTFTYNTILFSWSRLRDFADMGYGFRFGTRLNTNVSHNIIGLSTFSGLDRTRVDSDRNRESRRVTSAEHNVFFLNKQGDLTIPGGGMFMRISANDFEDVMELAEVAGNRVLTDPAAFRGRINQAYLTGFLNASYSETTDLDPNSPANQFRRAMGMPIQGTMQSTATMYANRYPWREALQLFGAMNGVGAQIPRS